MPAPNHTITIHPKGSTMRPSAHHNLHLLKSHWDLPGWILLLLWVNFPLLKGTVNTALMYQSDPVASGQWWRLLTYPLVHISWYHLILDGLAFLLLYNSLHEKRRWVKLGIIASCSGVSLTIGLLMGEVALMGLSGLSGVAHGLMAFSALEMTRLPGQRVWGWASLSLVMGKSLYEVATGEVVFAFMHMGLCGQPVAASHAGGVLGGMAAFAAFIAYRVVRSRKHFSSFPVRV